VRALKKQQALTGGEESSRKVKDLQDTNKRLKMLCDKRGEELKASFAERCQLQTRHDQQKLDQRLKYEDLELQRDTLAAQYQSLEQQLKKTQADYAAFVQQTNDEESATASTISKLRGEKQRLSTEHSKYSILYKDAKKKNDSLAAENATLRETAERSANPDVPGNSQQVPPPQPEVKQEQPTQQLVQANPEHHDDDADAKPLLVDGQLVGYEGDEDGGGV
jgi:myosin heavy subunit